MSLRRSVRASRFSWICLAVVFGVGTLAAIAQAGNNGNGIFSNRQVGGVLVDTDGVLAHVEADDTNRLRAARLEALQEVPGEVNAASPMRMISLRRLEAALQKQMTDFAPMSDEMKYLAGLQRVQYIFVLPEVHDIVLAGPGEGWKVNEKNEIVGVTTGKPVLHLDDLLVGLRAAERARTETISCSIDPTQQGLDAYQQLMRAQRTFSPQVIPAIEQALGPQTISLTGVPATSRFATVLVAADYRMKRLAMNFDPVPVKGLPTFLALTPASSRSIEMPRWWLAPNYQPLLKDEGGLAWEIRGSGVKAMAEEEMLNAQGEKVKTGRKGTPAHRWAEAMTEHYDELAEKEAIFAELRNCMDLAVVGALIAKEGLAEKAGFSMPLLLNEKELMIDSFNPPKTVASQASVLKKGRNWLISASGGVEIQPWEIADASKVDAELEALRTKVASDAKNDRWWWNGAAPQ